MRRFKARLARWCHPLGLVLAWAWQVAQAGPDIDPGALYRYLPTQRNTLVARLHNHGDATAFVRIDLAELRFNAQGQAEEQGLAEQAGFDRPLWATPPRAIVAAGAAQSIRLIYRGPRNAERYFRVRYTPVAPRPGDGFALQPDEAQAYADALKAGVGVLKGIGTLVIVPPVDSRYATRLEEDEQGLRIKNEGNATVRINGARYCDERTQACQLSPALHIRPGQETWIERQPGAVYRFELQEGQKVTHHVFPRPK